MTKDIIKYPDIDDITWQSVIDSLTTNLTKNPDIDEKIVMAAEMILSGFPLYKIAKQLNVSTDTVKGWLLNYPEITYAIGQARRDLTKWRLEQLEQQFLLAVNKSYEILTTDSYIYEDDDGVLVTATPNTKLLAVQAQHARYILNLFADRSNFNINIQVTETAPTLKAKQDALDYITGQLKKQEEEPIEATVRVISNDTRQGPLLDEDGNSLFGKLGELDHDKNEGTLCHVCGNRFNRLDIHIRVKENMSNEMYETIYMLPPGSLTEIIKQGEEEESDQRDRRKSD